MLLVARGVVRRSYRGVKGMFAGMLQGCGAEVLNGCYRGGGGLICVTGELQMCYSGFLEMLQEC